MISHSETDILECEVKWTLGSSAVNNASAWDRIPVELFKTLKDDAIKVLYTVGQQIWEAQQWPHDSSSQLPRRVVLKNVLTIRQLHSSPMLVRSCLKSCMLGFSISQIKNFQVSKLGLERQTDQRSNCQHLLDHRESKGIPEKHLLLFHQ